MEVCKMCEQEQPLVHSGVDALLLCCLDSLGEICYDCANQQAGRVTPE